MNSKHLKREIHFNEQVLPRLSWHAHSCCRDIPRLISQALQECQSPRRQQTTTAPTTWNSNAKQCQVWLFPNLPWRP